MAVLGKIVIGMADFLVSGSTIGYVTGPYMASEDGVIDSVSWYAASTGVNLKLGVYLHDEAQKRPATLIAATNPVSVSSIGWQTGNRISGSGVIEQGKRYWIASIADGNVTYHLNSTEEKWHWAQSGPYSTGLRNPFLTGGGATIGKAISAYFTYTPDAHDPEDNSLQGRINRASPGDTILVRGFQNERVAINKPLKLVGLVNRRTGALPIIQGGELVTGWTLSTAPEHSEKNVWYKDIRIDGQVACWIRALQIDDKSVHILQANPSLAGEGVDETGAVSATNPLNATAMRSAVLARAWSDPANPMFIVAGQTIDFWQWYDGIACHDSTGRLWLRLKNDANPNDSVCYMTATQNATAADNDDYNLTNDLASVIRIENQADVMISGIEIRGGRWGIDAQNCENITIEQCRVLTPALRSINISDCDGVLIQNNEITSRRMRSNLHPGFGGTSDRAKAAMFGWSLNKNYSNTGIPSPAGASIALAGATSNVTIKRNWMYGQGEGIQWGLGHDRHIVNATIENNIFENMDSAGILAYSKASGTVRNNIFYEVHLNFRIQDMGYQVMEGTLVTIESNYIHSFERAGYVLQAHYANGSTWTSPLVFNNNLVVNVADLIANLESEADVSMDGNVFDTAGSFSSGLVSNGMESFTNNWVGGNAESVKNLAWFSGQGNHYTLGQRLDGLTPPAGYTFPALTQSAGVRKQRGWFAWNA